MHIQVIVNLLNNLNDRNSNFTNNVCIIDKKIILYEINRRV